MNRPIYFITHPNVVISRDVPIPDWPLSERGIFRMRQGLAQPWVAGISAIYCSNERKAMDGAGILANHLSLRFESMQELGENDRSTTGFLPPDEFECVADEFFAHPEVSVRGWERALDAQRRIARAVDTAVASDRSQGAIAIVSHGAVGTLLYCHLTGTPIDRRWDQPANGGGNYFSFTSAPPHVRSWWKPFDDLTAPP